MKNILRTMGYILCGFYVLLTTPGQAAVDSFNSQKLKAPLSQPSYDHFVVYSKINFTANNRTVELIRVDSKIGVSAAPVVLYTGSTHVPVDIKINKDLAGLTYITFEEIKGNGIYAIPNFHEVTIPNLSAPNSFIYRTINLPVPTGGTLNVVGCDQAVNPVTIEQYFVCGVADPLSGTNALDIWVGKSPNFTTQPQWQKITTVNQSGDLPDGMGIMYDSQKNELLVRFHTNGFFLPAASRSIYEMTLDPLTLAVKNPPQIISGNHTINTQLLGSGMQYSPSINSMSLPIQKTGIPFTGAAFRAKISGTWQDLLTVPDAENVQQIGTADSNLAPSLFFAAARLTRGQWAGADTLTAYLFSGPPLYQNLQQIPLGQVNTPVSESYGFVATLQGRYSNTVPIAVLYEDNRTTGIRQQKILFTTGDLTTGIFSPLKSVYAPSPNNGLILELAVETIP